MHVVKLARGGWSTILFVGSLEDAEAKAASLNEQYQTDEYKVEPWKSA